MNTLQETQQQAIAEAPSQVHFHDLIRIPTLSLQLISCLESMGGVANARLSEGERTQSEIV